ncbi:SWIM zinc finger family protein [Paenibacillus silviterrae]|uniref:SWIM zinc finger family protein n=1 Tax=Paenibacillus silviterrae TaxID=3242194 RepID=UPI0025435B1A|nr:SWIM zinc finger family protein [Paenibacillus chinjuensis]
MINVTESYVDSLAQNSGAIKNGKDLVKKNKFPLLQHSEDGTLLFGECQGSGKEPYRCSVDFAAPGQPVFRCSCPSRQFPCKHNLGLMYAYAAGQPFAAVPIPPDILEKREKAEKREEKKKESADSDAPQTKRKTNKAALAKKIASQLEGIVMAEKLIEQMVQTGLGSVDKSMLQTMEEQTKQLGNYYIPGIQKAIRDVILPFRIHTDREQAYSEAIDRLAVLQSLLKRSKHYLQERLDTPDLPVDMNSSLEEWIGHAWQMAELRENGRVRSDAELLQLAFRSYSDDARGEFVDEGFWADLQSGDIRLTRTYRPFRAAKYIREEDSVFDVVKAKEVARYPGDGNARVRWEEAVHRQAASEDYKRVQSFAKPSYPDVIKAVKNQIKHPLSDKHPVVLLHYKEIVRAGESYVLLDEDNRQISMADIAYLNEPTTHLLPMLNETLLKRQAVLVMFEQRMQEGRLTAQPLSIVTPEAVVRLLY